jgi:hypothetical protein
MMTTIPFPICNLIHLWVFVSFNPGNQCQATGEKGGNRGLLNSKKTEKAIYYCIVFFNPNDLISLMDNEGIKS